jgi:hypothetical protein
MRPLQARRQAGSHLASAVHAAGRAAGAMQGRSRWSHVEGVDACLWQVGGGAQEERHVGAVLETRGLKARRRRGLRRARSGRAGGPRPSPQHNTSRGAHASLASRGRATRARPAESPHGRLPATISHSASPQEPCQRQRSPGGRHGRPHPHGRVEHGELREVLVGRAEVTAVVRLIEARHERRQRVHREGGRAAQHCGGRTRGRRRAAGGRAGRT